MSSTMKNIRRRLVSESAIDKEYFKEHIEQHPVKDISLNIFYQSHTLTVLVLILIGLTYFAFSRNYESNFKDDLFTGVMVALFVFLIISTMIMPNGPFVRPHPVVWRVVFGLSLAYFLCVVGTLFLRLEDARSILFYLDPKLSTMRHSDILDKEYAVNCSEITFQRVWSHMDVFAFGHFFGWLIKAILLRNYVILWVLSINWEITEVAFSHILPNFQECWWDSIVLDVLVCNGLGIYAGMLLCQWFHARSYEWESIRDIKSTRGKFKRAVLQFTPVSWTPTHWLDRDSSFKRIFQLSLLIVIWQIAELNIFFLKHVFIVKPSHFLTQTRLAIITLSSAPAIRQYYYYIVNDQVTRIGSQLWIFLSTLLVELLVAFKLGSEVFENTILWNVVYWLIWLIFTSFVTVAMCQYLAKIFRCPPNVPSMASVPKQKLQSGPGYEDVNEDEEEENDSVNLLQRRREGSPPRRRITRAAANNIPEKEH